MTAQGSMSGANLTFSMQHQMALAVIDLPRTEYSLSSDASYTWKTDTPDTKFTGFSPCRMSDGTYRYLVKPDTSGNLSGSYTNTGNQTVEWSFTATVNAHKYKVFTVDRGATTVIKKSHTLQAGDFFINDGSLVGKDKKLTDAQKAACIGIVFYIGEGDGDSDHSGLSRTVNGYVIALNNADYDTSIGVTWGPERYWELSAISTDVDKFDG